MKIEQFIGGLMVASVLFIAFTSLVIIPQNKIDAQERAQREEASAKRLAEVIRQSNIDDCLNSAHDAYSADWDGACEILGRKSSCSLPTYRAESLGERMEKENTLCIKRY